MRSFAMSLFAVVAFLPAVCQAQLFPRLFGGKQTAQVGSSCPGGVCPTAAPASNYRSVGVNLTRSGTSWVNRDGLSPRAHIEQEHGTNTAGMSHAEVLAERDHYHNTYGAGHPVKESRSRSIGLTVTRSNTQQVNYPTVSSSVGYGSSGVRVSGYGSSGSAVGFGSSGSFGVGTVLPDGGVVTSVGVTVAAKTGCGCGCPNCTCNGVQSAEASEMRAVGAGIGDRVKFRRSLLAAARKAKESGSITSMEFFVLSAASRNPAVLTRMQEAVHEAAIEDGMASVNAVDWDSLIEFIEKLIPIIIKLIDLFS